PDATVAALVEALPKGAAKKPALGVVPQPKKARAKGGEKDDLAVEDLALHLREALGEREVCLTHISLSWHGAWWHFRHPLDYIGSDGGGGVGGGPRISIGAAPALKGSRRRPVGGLGGRRLPLRRPGPWSPVRVTSTRVI